MKKPYDRMKDCSFVPPTVVRTSKVRVSEKNCDLIRKFVSDLMDRNSIAETMCFVRKESVNGEVVRESRKVSAETFNLNIGVVFQYIHTLGVSERIIIREDVAGVHVDSVYTISG